VKRDFGNSLFMFDKMKWEAKGCREIVVVRFVLFKDGLV
jgi:hypothetical protein